MADLDNLTQQLDQLKIAVEKSEGVLDLLSSIHDHIEPDKDIGSSASDLVAQLVPLISQPDDVTVAARAANLISTLAKSDGGRAACNAESRLIAVLMERLAAVGSNGGDIQVLGQTCRALGNIIFEALYNTSETKKAIVDGDGLVLAMKAIKYSIAQGNGEHARQLRTYAVGFLHNLIIAEEELYQKALDMDIMEVLGSVLEQGVLTREGEEAAIHAAILLNVLTESADPPGSLQISERISASVVKTLEASNCRELSELWLQLLHSQAENETVRMYLAKAGLCELLIQLLEKHHALVKDDETRNLMKMACDLIIIIMNGDESMNLLYGEGKGKVFVGMLSWLTSTDVYMQITGALAMGNFARTDRHCIQMVDCGVSKKLIALLSNNNTSAADIRLQHALLSALRNLVIPSQNKSKVLADGLLDAIFPVLTVPTFPVVFKLLGTLRMVIDGQESAARQLGCNRELLSRLVEWCTTDDHPGVQGEASRLLAWLVKNSRDRDVMGCMVATGAVQQLVAMITAEHWVMQGEALLALSLLAAMRLADAEPHLLEAKVGDRLVAIINPSLERHVFTNLLSLVSQLATSSDMKQHLRERGVPKALSMIVSLKDNMADMRDQVSRLTSMLEMS
ncbi:rap1 GTPase-GDP dissociation stimulator 1 [Nilaparvata lugens]|uniref:rap1 GTPase-GDP dissociation stimulator 1 n=1 Tax=Nilaparvata lugens TaxID=108931 RepID=UPI00193E8703|nr:rap1 GTPase-GDP dissociation stimulator 1 [Nilaparvata lugens]